MPHPQRTCILCAKTDDHPRIVRVTPDGAPDVNMHHDCYTLAFPDDGSDPGVTEMHAIVKHAAGKQGDELREYLLSDGHRKFKAKLEAQRDAQLEGAKA